MSLWSKVLDLKEIEHILECFDCWDVEFALDGEKKQLYFDMCELYEMAAGKKWRNL